MFGRKTNIRPYKTKFNLWTRPTVVRIITAFLCVLVSSSGENSLGQEEILANNWNVFDVGAGTKPSFDFDAQGRIHVMGMIEALDGGVWYDVAESAAGPWDPEYLSTGYFYGPGDIRVGADGAAHMAWHDHNLTNARHLRVTPNSTQSFLFDTPNSHDGWDNSLDFDSQGTLFQASVFPSSFGASTSLYIASFDGSSWSGDAVPDSGSFMYGFDTSLAIDQDDQPHVLYTEAGNWTAPGDLKHAFQTNDGWNVETVVTGGIRGRFSSLVFDDQNHGHAVWLDIDQADDSIGTVMYGELAKGEWTTSTVATLDKVVLGFDGGRKQTSIALTSDGTPVIAFGDRETVNYAKRTGNQWDSQIVLENDSQLYNGLVVLRVNPVTDEPTIAFWQNDDFAVGFVRLVTGSLSAVTAGDFNDDNIVDATDVNLLVVAIANGSDNERFDINHDGSVTIDDQTAWVHDIKRTYLGDANLDGEFNSEDLIVAFRRAEYEDDVPINSDWEDGDWNGDREFDSGDFVAAFQDGGYESGPQVNQAVPEPASMLSLLIGVAGCLWFVLRRN